MLDLEPLFEFSRNNCVAICAFLVPANLLATLQTIALSVTGKSLLVVRLAAGFAAIFAITLFLHVSTWLSIGVITPVTFILLGLGSTCLLGNWGAIVYRQKFFDKTLLNFFKRSQARKQEKEVSIW
jgi:hypothetical protein